MHTATLNLLKSLSVLVVEDDEIARLMIAQGIKPYCEAYYQAKDGLDGLEIFKKHRIDVIITDIHMPNLNGFEMMKEILTLKPLQPFIVMTSYDTDQNIIHSIHEGASSFLRKPINIKELQTALLMVSGHIEHDTLKQITPNITIDSRKEVIYKDGEPIFLTNNNHKIFWLLCYNLGRIVSYEMFEDYVYGGETVNKSVLHVSILRIKQQLGHIHIENITNLGYVLKPYSTTES